MNNEWVSLSTQTRDYISLPRRQTRWKSELICGNVRFPGIMTLDDIGNTLPGGYSWVTGTIFGEPFGGEFRQGITPGSTDAVVTLFTRDDTTYWGVIEIVPPLVPTISFSRTYLIRGTVRPRNSTATIPWEATTTVYSGPIV